MYIGRDVASGADRHLDIIDCRYRVVESSSLVSVLLREAFSHPTSPFFCFRTFSATNYLPYIGGRYRWAGKMASARAP